MPHPERRAAWLGVACGFCLAVGCAGGRTVYEQKVDLARRAYENGDYGGAARHWHAAEQAAESQADRDEASYRAAVSLIRAGRVAEGQELLAALLARGGTIRGARAEFDLATLEIERGDEARGHRMLREALVHHPNHGVAREALRRRRAFVVDTQGAQAAEEDLTALAREVAGSALESAALFERAKLLEARGADAAASSAYRELIRRFPYPNGEYWNDCSLAAARLERQLGHPLEAEALLTAMLAERESSALTGSYERGYDEASYLLAELSLERGLWRAARDRLLLLVDQFENSRLRDDALWGAATLSARQGDAEAACQLLGRLEREMPDSRFNDCRGLACTTDPSSARCSDYIRRAFENGLLRPPPSFDP